MHFPSLNKSYRIHITIFMPVFCDAKSNFYTDWVLNVRHLFILRFASRESSYV